MRRRRAPLPLALLAAALVAAPAVAATPPPPHVVDPAGDADALDGKAGTASQARFDLRSVTLRTVRTGFTVTFQTQGSTTLEAGSFFLAGDLDGCGDLRISAGLDAQAGRAGARATWTCTRLPGRPQGSVALPTPVVRGRTVVVTVPLSRLHRSTKAGTRYGGFAAGVAPADPLHDGTTYDAAVDRARGTRGYVIGS